MSSTAAGSSPARDRARRAGAGILTSVVAASGAIALGVVGAPAASAAPAQVTNATFTWDINNEVNAGAFAPGTWNLMSAGKIGNPGAGGQTLKLADSGATWNNGAAAGWKNTDGNVTIEDKAADGSYAPTTYEGTRRNSANALTSGASQTILAETRMVVKNGVGSLDAASDNASITWDGDATVLFYSGMTYFTLSDPKLTLTGGAGTVTATVGGYATSMDDSTEWEPVADQTVTLATLSGVDVTATGLTATPAYRQVPYTAPSGSSAQVTTGANWGAFPQAFVDFQQQLGQGPYWYSTGGTADPRKVANPLSVGFSEHQASVQVSKTSFLPSGAQQVTVTGSGFTPALATGTRPPLAGRPSGTYVVFGKFAEAWKPSAGAASATRGVGSQKWAVAAADMETIGGAGSGAVELKPDGTFTTTLTVNKPALDATATAGTLVNYGIYTYGGSGAGAPAFETYTPVTFAQATPTVTVAAPSVAQGLPATATVTVGSTTGVTATGSVTLTQGETTIGTQPLDGTGKAVFDLGSARPVGSYPLSASYAGDAAFTPATGTGTLLVAAPSVTLSRTNFVPNGAQTVTVTGTGFNPAAATGTRPPLAGRPSGTYVVFGKFAEAWKPSTGAASSTRVNSSQKWAVLAEDMATVGGPDAGAVELKPDGSFTTTLTVDKAAIDALATAGTLVNYGVYTYGGSGGTVAAYETATPITFARATPTVTVTAPAVTYGEAATATVTVAGDGDNTGTVTLTDGATEIGTEDLEDGTATFDLGTALTAGDHALTATYAGDPNTAEGDGTATLVVAPAGATVSIAVPNRTYGQASVATVTVDSPVEGGTVTLKRGTVTVGTTDVVAGRATFALGELPAGRHALSASYSGTDDVAATTATGTATVAKATSKATVKLTKKPTAKKAGRAQAKVVTSPAGSATGSVKLVLRTSGGKLVKQVTAKLTKQGLATAALPKLAKGGYKLVVTYAGTANVTSSSKTFTFKVG